MNTLNGYSKSTLTDTYVLTAAGGHLAVGNAANNIPLNNSTVNTNLNADLLDGKHASGLLTALSSNTTNKVSLTVGGTTKNITTLYASYLCSVGTVVPLTKRTQAYGNVYSYHTNASAYTGAPTTYTATIGFGKGTEGTVEICGEWTSGRGLWVRALKDTIDDWYAWDRILTEATYSKVLDNRYYTETEVNNKLAGYLPLAGGTMNNGAAITIQNQSNIIHTTVSMSNAVRTIQWYKGSTHDTTYTYPACLGWHNTGGDGDGAISLVPYALNSAWWSGGAGLYIARTFLLFNNKYILHSGNYTLYVNSTNFPGLNKVGTVTSVTVTGSNGLSGSGTVTTSGTITLSNAGVRSTTINGNFLRVNTNGTNADLTIPYATTASLLNNTPVSDPSKAASGQNVKWYSQISSSSGYAGTNYGFPVSNNANGILWLGTHSGLYGWLMGFSSNGHIYARYISNNSFSTTANGGSWGRIAWASDIPAVTNYYWANVKVSSSSSTTTTPTFAKWTTSDLNLVSYTTGGKDLGMRVTGSVSSIGFIVESSNTNRGIYDYTNGVWIVRKDSSNNTLLESGNVGIGITSPSAKLHVAGLVNITANSGTLTIGCLNTSYTHYSTTGGTHWFNKAVEVEGNLSPYTNDSFTLGTSSKRWSNIYSVLGNFSGAVTIGGKTTTVGLENNGHYSWKGGYNFYCIPSGNDQEWSFDIGSKAYGDGTNSTYTGTYLLMWSCKNSGHIARFFNDSRHVDIPVHLFVGGYNNTSYALSTSTFICNSWVRTKGATGWYNEDYGGGWYMNNADYVKVYNGKRVYTSNTSQYAFYTDGGVTAAGFYKASSSNSYVLLGGGGHKAIGNASGNIALNNGTLCTNLNADKLDGIDSTGFIQTSGLMLKGFYGTLEGYHGETGWHRIATINSSGKGHGSYILYLCGNWIYSSNTTAIIHINTRSTTASITLVSGILGFVNKIRLVNISFNLFYVDININYSDNPDKTNDTPGTVYFYFLGNGSVTVNTEAEKITTSVTASAEISIINGGKIDNAGNSDTVDNYHISVGSSAGSNASTIYFVI